MKRVVLYIVARFWQVRAVRAQRTAIRRALRAKGIFKRGGLA
jgi:hypothetical protein